MPFSNFLHTSTPRSRMTSSTMSTGKRQTPRAQKRQPRCAALQRARAGHRAVSLRLSRYERERERVDVWDGRVGAESAALGGPTALDEVWGRVDGS
eukprot:365057-Chlamydomonas_euryale.AAC.8